MNLPRDSEDCEPLARVRGFPVYVTSLLVVAHCLALAMSWAALHLGAGRVLERLSFSSSAVLGEGAVWQWLTYIWVEPVGNPLFFLIGMLVLYTFGREVERTLGRRHYLLLYALLVVVPPVLLTLAGFFHPFVLAGSGHVHFAVFLGFALLYPRVEFFLRVRAIWLAVVLLSLYGLYYIVASEWSAFITLAASVVVLRLFLQWSSGEGWLLPPVAEAPQLPSSVDPMDEIDPLLEKIAREGMASLTARELAALERAREELLARQEQ